MPTKPDVQTVSRSLMTATASSAETILSLLICSSIPGQQPFRYALAQRALRFARHEQADMAAGQFDFLIILGPDMFAERARAGRRDDVVVQRKNVENRRGD